MVWNAMLSPSKRQEAEGDQPGDDAEGSGGCGIGVSGPELQAIERQAG
jgi:hypothetical protein